MSPRAWLLALVLYGLGAAVFTAPMPLHLSTHIWGDRFDAWTTLWLIEHLAQGVRSGTLEAQTQHTLYPLGYNLWSFGHIGVQMLGVPLRLAGLGLTTTYNLLLLGAFAATGACGHALGRHLSGRHAGGVVAGVILAFNPYLYGEMSAGCVELVAAMLLPLYALALVRLCEAPGPRRALVAALTLAAIGPMNWYYTAFAALFTGAFWIWRALAGGATRRGSLTWIAAACALAAALNAPLIPLVRQETPTRTAIRAETFGEEGWALSARVADGTLTLGDLTQEALEQNDAMQVVINSTSITHLARGGFPANPLESTPGRLAWGLGAVGLAAAGRRGLGWALIAGAFTVLMLGPFLQLDATPPLPEWSATLPLPYYALYNHLPFFSKAYRPYRLGIVVLLGLAALAATGWAALRGRRWDVLAALAALAAVSQPHWAGLSSRQLADATIPAFYTQLGALPRGAVLELPLHYQPVTPANARYMFNQVAHGMPLLNCNQLIRRTDLARFRDYVQGNSLLRFALDLGRQDPPYAVDWADVHALRAEGFRYIVAHEQVDEEQLHLAGAHGAADRVRQPAWDLLQQLLGAPVLRGATGELAWELPAAAPTAGLATPAGPPWVDVPLAWAELRLPIQLGTTPQALPLPGPAQRLALWALRSRADPSEGAVHVQAGAVDHPLTLTPGRWTRVELALPPGTTAVTLRAVGAPVRLVLASVQAQEAP